MPTRTDAHSMILANAQAGGGDPAARVRAMTVAAETLDADGLAAEVEALAAIRKAAQATADEAKVATSIAESVMVNRLGEGEAVQAPSGRMGFRGKVSGGRRTLVEAAMVEHRDELPEDCKPVQVWKLPTLATVDAAVKGGTIPRRLVSLIIHTPPKVDAIRWRTLDLGEEE